MERTAVRIRKIKWAWLLSLSAELSAFASTRRLLGTLIVLSVVLLEINRRVGHVFLFFSPPMSYSSKKGFFTSPPKKLAIGTKAFLSLPLNRQL